MLMMAGIANANRTELSIKLIAHFGTHVGGGLMLHALLNTGKLWNKSQHPEFNNKLQLL